MRFGVKINGNLDDLLERERRKGGMAAKAAMSAVAGEIKAAWRRQVTAAGLGPRLANSVRSESYPKGGGSLGAAALVWTRAPEILAAFERGATIHARNSVWLAIPLPAAGFGANGRRITPAEWERRRGLKLRFFYRGGRTALLVADNARVSKRAKIAMPKRGKVRRDGILTGAQTVPVFVLVPQVTLRKRLNLVAEAQRLSRNLPTRIVAGWK